MRTDPGAAAWLSALSDGAIDAIDAGADGLRPAPGLPPKVRRWLDEAARLTALGAWPQAAAVAARTARQGRLRWRVPGRKWAQVERFAAAVLPAAPEVRQVVDWCGGKGHLGRTLAALTARPATVVELDGALGDEARMLARRAGATLTFAEADALTPAAGRLITDDALVVGLHACGGLTNALIDGAGARDPAEVAVSPCCYHRAHGDALGTTPLSRAARGARLALDHSVLRLATADEVVAPLRQRRGRRRENAWRLGYDLLLREASGDDVYTPLGPLPPALVGLPFGDFCQQLAARRGDRLPPRWDPGHAEAAGVERARTARALGLVRAIFRRPVELWLALDRAMALQERGYAVGVAEFCPRAVTPRNLMIRGARAV